MQILPSTASDLDTIFDLYKRAIEFQKSVSNQHWLPFEEKLVTTEISEKRQWKILLDNKVVCVFAITFSDPFIWKEKNNDPAIYIHRIATHPQYRGNNFVEHIVNWAKEYGKANSKKFVRMDTWGDNFKLKSYYERFGFNFSGIITPSNTDELPAHYSAITLALFELPIT